MQSRSIRRIAIDLRKEHRFSHSWRKSAIVLGIVTKDGRPDPAMASRIAKKGYEPHSIPVRARLGLKPYCFVCKQAIRKPRVKREPGKPSALSEARKILAKYATQGAPEAMWWIKEYGG